MTEYRLTLSFSTSDALLRKRVAFYAAMLIAAFGLVLRFYQLGSESIWIDEALTHVFSRYSLASLWNPVGDADLTPPLWYTVQKAWLIFGDSEAALRSPAALAGALAIPVVFAIGKLSAGNRAGLLAGLLLATSVAHVHYSQTARAYALLFLAAAVALWALIYLLADPQRAMMAFRRDGAGTKRRMARLAWAAYGFGTMIALYSHNTAVFLPVWANICWLIIWLRTGRAPAFLVAWLCVNAAVALSFAWWLPIVIHQSVDTLAGAKPGGRHYTSWSVMIEILRSVYGVRHIPTLAGTTATIAVILASFGSWRLRRNLPALLALAGVVVFVPAVSAIFGLWLPILADATLLWPLASLTVLVAIGILGLSRWAAMLVGVAFIGLNLAGLSNYYDKPVRQNWRGVAQYIAESADKSDPVVFWPQYERFPFHYHFRRSGIGEDPPNIHGVWPEDSGVRLRRSDRHGKLTDVSLVDLTHQYRTIWLVVSYPWDVGAAKSVFGPLGIMEEARRLGDIHIFRIAVPPFALQ